MSDENILKPLFNVAVIIAMITLALPHINDSVDAYKEPQFSHSSPSFDFNEVRDELLCMQISNEEYESKGMMKAELDLSESQLRELAHALEDNGYINVNRGIVSVDGDWSSKFFEQTKTVNASYCNPMLEYSTVEGDTDEK